MQRRFCACLALVLAYLACVPSAGADDAAAEGERIYENYCATCHGEKLQHNAAGLTFDLRRLKADNYSRFVDSVLNGKNTMPPWKDVLTNTEIERLWAYIQANGSP
jgi:mono/diheme cytochrome c family protein